MIVIGADTHKRTHALAAVDAGTGRQRGARQITAEEPGYLAAVRWARGLDDERVWAIEDCRHVSRRFEEALIAAGERVVRVAPHRMVPPGGPSASRASRTRSTRSRSPGRWSRTAWSASPRPISTGPRWRFACCPITARISSPSARARRTGCVGICSSCALRVERSLGRGSLAEPRQLARVDRRLCRLPARARVRIAREQIAQLRVLTRRVDALERELHALVMAHRPRLLAETGCGALTAALLIGRTAGAQRFPSDASFARQTGTAPIPCSLRATPPPPARPRRRPPAQPRPAHHRHHPRPPRPRHPGLPGAQGSRGQGQEGSTPLPQAAPGAPLPPPALPPGPDPASRSEHRRPRAPRCTATGRHLDRQRRARTHALHQLRTPLQAKIT
jgi:transposase